MKTNVADTSIEAYHGHTVGDLTEGQRRVMAVIKEGRDYSRAEIAKASGLPLQSVCGRVNELLTAKRLEHGPRRECAITQNTVNPVRLPARQMELI